jgi:hypothetical protein
VPWTAYVTTGAPLSPPPPQAPSKNVDAMIAVKPRDLFMLWLWFLDMKTPCELALQGVL